VNISESFKSRADTAAFWEAWVAACLTRAELEVLLLPLTIAKTDEEFQSYQKRVGDILVGIPGHPKRSVEVKSASRNFVTAKDVPERMLLCSDASHRRKTNAEHNTSYAHFLMVSTVTGAIIWVPKGTPTEVTVVTDSSRNETYKCRTVARADVRELSDFVEHLEREFGYAR
jgi:hypothetical protein